MKDGDFPAVDEDRTVEAPKEEPEKVKPGSDQVKPIPDESRRRMEENVQRVELLLQQAQEAEREEQERERKEREQREKQQKEEERDFVIHKFQKRKAPTVAELGSLFGESIVLDERTNTVVVAVETTQELAKVANVLKALDAPSERESYKVEAVIVTAQLGNADEFSIDWIAKYNYPQPITLQGQNEFANGQIQVNTEWLELAVDRAKTEGHLKVHARPSLILAQGETANISSGREVPLPETNVQDGNAQTSIVYRRVALELAVTLQEIGAGRLSLGISQVNEQINGQNQIGDIEVPELGSQRWETQIEPTFGRWYAVGGVAAETVEEVKRFGWIFKNRDDKRSTRQEIGLFIRVVPVGEEIPPTPSEYLHPHPVFRAVPITQK